MVFLVRTIRLLFFEFVRKGRCIMEKAAYDLKNSKAKKNEDSTESFNKLMADLNHDTYKSRYDQ